MISGGGGAEDSTIAHVKSGWKIFRVLLPLLASRIIFLKKKSVYMLLASEVLWFMVSQGRRYY